MTKWVALVVLLCLGCATAWGAQLTEADYVAAVGRAADQLERAAKLGEDGREAADRAFADFPLKAEVVDARGGRVLSVDNREFVKLLRRQIAYGPEGRRAAAGALRNLQAGSSEQPALGTGDPRAVLTNVLSRREFKESWLGKLRQRVYAWLWRIFLALLGLFPDVKMPRNLLAWIIWTLVGIATLIVLTLVVRLVMRYEPRRAKKPALEAEEVVIRSHDEWLAEAEDRSSEGDYRGALRAVHMAALLKLDEAGVIRFDHSATDNRFVRLLRSRGLEEMAAALGALNSLFSVVWYGCAPAGPQEYIAARARWADLETLTAT